MKFLSKPRAGTLKLALAVASVMTVAGASTAAQAYQAFVNAPAPLRAGPAGNYPPIVGLTPGQPVEVYGCLAGYQWCDIAVGPDRGWFNGTWLDFPYGGQRETVLGFGVRVGVPVISFSVDDYWGHYYRDRPFYAQRGNWDHQVPPGHRWDHHHHDDDHDHDNGHHHGHDHDDDH